MKTFNQFYKDEYFEKPKKLEDCVKEVMAQGKSKDSAWAICQSSVMSKSIPDPFEQYGMYQGFVIYKNTHSGAWSAKDPTGGFMTGPSVVLEDEFYSLNDLKSEIDILVNKMKKSTEPYWRAQGKSKDSAWAICQASVMGKSSPMDNVLYGDEKGKFPKKYEPFADRKTNKASVKEELAGAKDYQDKADTYSEMAEDERRHAGKLQEMEKGSGKVIDGRYVNPRIELDLAELDREHHSKKTNKANTSLAGGVPNSLLAMQDLEGKKKTLKSISIIKKGKVTNTFKSNEQYLSHIGKSFVSYWKSRGVHFNDNPYNQNSTFLPASGLDLPGVEMSVDNGVMTVTVPNIGYQTQYQYYIEDMPAGGQRVSFN